MAHQQKLVHMVDLTGIAANGAQAVNTLLQLAGDPYYEVAGRVSPHQITCEANGGDPGATSRWWTTNRTVNGFTFNWAGYNVGINLRIVAHLFHSICFDISSATPPY